MGRGRAFTLIELMIAIAILAIMFGVATSTYMQLGGLQRQIEYGHSLTQSNSQLEALRAVDFESLPPQSLTVGPENTLELAQQEVLENSIVVRDEATGIPLTNWTFDSKNSRLTLPKRPDKGKVIVDYEFFLGSQNFTQLSDAQARVALPRGVNLKIERVFLAKGDEVVTVPDYQQKDGYLQLPAALSNQLVVLDYYDEEGRNKVSGSFLDGNFRETGRVTGTKLIQVQEPFAGVWKMSLPLIKEQKT